MCKSVSDYLTDRSIGDWSISHFEITENDIIARINGIPCGHYVRLKHKGNIVMSNTPMERRTNRYFTANAHGDVLIGGLGIGMILLDIQDKASVKSITVLEKNQEVIDLVAPQLPLNDKIKIICADVFTWKPAKDVKFDCIYMDIWDSINRDVYEYEMKPLKRKYGHYLKSKEISPNRFNSCWAEYEAQNRLRLI